KLDEDLAGDVVLLADGNEREEVCCVVASSHGIHLQERPRRNDSGEAYLKVHRISRRSHQYHPHIQAQPQLHVPRLTSSPTAFRHYLLLQLSLLCHSQILPPRPLCVRLKRISTRLFRERTC